MHRVSEQFLDSCSQLSCVETIVRFRHQPTFLVVPGGGTQTDVWVRQDSTVIHKTFRASAAKVVDLTDLADGTYRVSVLGCSLAGGFRLVLRSKG